MTTPTRITWWTWASSNAGPMSRPKKTPRATSSTGGSVEASYDPALDPDASARALRQAVTIDPGEQGVPSTKGLL